jgi:CelD/BcsL family acetyltransferase involved in cellulose biosynthesis
MSWAATFTSLAVTSVAGVESFAERWDGVPAGGSSDIFTSPAWCLAAWRAFPDLGSPMLLLVTDQSGHLLAVLPLTAGPHGPSWPASPLGDEHDPRISSDAPAELVGRALLRLAAGTHRQRSITLRDTRPGGILAGLADSRAGCPAPFVRLRDPDHEFEALACIPGWSRKQRRTLRSAHRRLSLTGAVSVQRIADPASLAVALPDFARSRLAAWDRRGRLAELPSMDRHPRFPEFLGEAGARLGAGGRCMLLRLLVDRTPIAQSLFFRSADADLLYMSTYEPSLARYSPSHLLLAEAARLALDDGVRTIELGRGDERYKFDLGAQPRRLRDVDLGR